MKFEYKIITVSKAHLGKSSFQAELATKFNDWGQDGWDLIKIEGITEGSLWQGANTTDFLIIFKRQME